jgi:hypothetical protein
MVVTRSTSTISTVLTHYGKYLYQVVGPSRLGERMLPLGMRCDELRGLRSSIRHWSLKGIFNTKRASIMAERHRMILNIFITGRIAPIAIIR